MAARSKQGHTMRYNPTTPNQCPYEVPIPTPYRASSLQQGQRSNQGYTMTMHTYNPQPVSLPSIYFLHLTVPEI